MTGSRRAITKLLVVCSLVVPSVLVATAGQARAVDLYVASDPPPATVGQAYSYQLIVVGGAPPYTFTITNAAAGASYAPGLPEGLSITAGGLIHGTPLVPERSEFEYDVRDTAGDSSGGRFLSMTVSSGNATLDPVLIPLDTNALIAAGQNSGSVLNQILGVVAVIENLPSGLVCILQGNSRGGCPL